MAILHAATITPTKSELIAAWLPDQSWAPSGSGTIDLVGSYRFDDPEGRVGMEGHLVRSGDVLLHVPLTYRDAPLEAAASSLVGTMEHSVLGERYIYDGLGDPVFVMMFAAVAMTGVGQAVGIVEHDGRWLVAPPPVRLIGGGWSLERIAVDGFEAADDDGSWTELRSDRFDLHVARRPVAGERPDLGLAASWDGLPTPVVLGMVRPR